MDEIPTALICARKVSGNWSPLMAGMRFGSSPAMMHVERGDPSRSAASPPSCHLGMVVSEGSSILSASVDSQTRRVGSERSPGRAVEGGRPRPLNNRGHDAPSFV